MKDLKRCACSIHDKFQLQQKWRWESMKKAFFKVPIPLESVAPPCNQLRFCWIYSKKRTLRGHLEDLLSLEQEFADIRALCMDDLTCFQNKDRAHHTIQLASASLRCCPDLQQHTLWGFILEHPATFQTAVMSLELERNLKCTLWNLADVNLIRWVRCQADEIDPCHSSRNLCCKHRGLWLRLTFTRFNYNFLSSTIWNYSGTNDETYKIIFDFFPISSPTLWRSWKSATGTRHSCHERVGSNWKDSGSSWLGLWLVHLQYLETLCCELSPRDPVVSILCDHE